MVYSRQLMMEQSQIGVGHNDAMLVAGGNDTSVIGGACGTANVGDTALSKKSLVRTKNTR